MKRTKLQKLDFSSNGRLKLQRETIKTLLTTQLRQVAGAATGVHTCSSDEVICDPT